MQFRKPAGNLLAQNERGFTLIEMMIVIGLIATVMGWVGTRIFRQQARARVDQTKVVMRQLSLAIEDFNRECGFYPTTEQGLDALVQKPSGGRDCRNYDPKGYVSNGKIPKDAWGNDFNYESTGSTFKLVSLGADGNPGGEDLDRDVSSDEAE